MGKWRLEYHEISTIQTRSGTSTSVHRPVTSQDRRHRPPKRFVHEILLIDFQSSCLMTKRKVQDRSESKSTNALYLNRDIDSIIASLSAVALRRQLQALNHHGAAHEGRHGTSQSLSETTPVRSTHASSRRHWLEGSQERLDQTPHALDDHPRSSCSSPGSGGSYTSSGDSFPDNGDGSVVADVRFVAPLRCKSQL